MELKARTALSDCGTALEMYLAIDPLDRRGARFRISWLGLVANLRSVGHVLKLVDTKNDPEFRQAEREEWDAVLRSKPEPHIFWDFIQDERNQVVKAHEFGARTGLHLPDAFDNPDGRRTDIFLDETDIDGKPTPAGPFDAMETMVGDHFDGRIPADVAREAIEWWRGHLDHVEARAAQLKSESQPVI